MAIVRKDVLDYQAVKSNAPVRKRKIFSALGVIGVTTCLLQLPAIYVGAWINWAFVWGDKDAPVSSYTHYNYFIISPSVVAILLGITCALGGKRVHYLLAMIAIFGGSLFLVLAAEGKL